ncbi:hypothetical protein G7Y89_g12653 [Cudoniella acicularis]|uniref:NmrA-like domain-containing protein n=1 Tax=Cudoniella acicularis TaxID=354080 RepID=A0A8H4VZG2_9HELO|nr:hypothetical protein G7Y89_g12653 [Cudoniella acicularis]
MSKQKVFLVGATGETGSSILEALIEDGSFDITCFIRTVSAGKPAVQQLRDRGLKVVTGNFFGPIEEITALLQGINTVISTIFPLDVAEQIPLIDASVQAGVKRFLPCNWGTPSPRGGIMDIRDLKEEVHDHIFRQHLGFTIIDVGYWHEATFPRVPSGKFDYAAFLPINEVYAGGTVPNMLMDKRDVGRITAKLSRTSVLLIKGCEKLELVPVSVDEIRAAVKIAKEAAESDLINVGNKHKLVISQYCESKYVQAHNTPEYAEYLGYINGLELYPDFEYIKFADFVDELIAGKNTALLQIFKHFALSSKTKLSQNIRDSPPSPWVPSTYLFDTSKFPYSAHHLMRSFSSHIQRHPTTSIHGSDEDVASEDQSKQEIRHLEDYEKFDSKRIGGRQRTRSLSDVLVVQHPSLKELDITSDIGATTTYYYYP